MSKTQRHHPPAHYLLKVKSYSLMSTTEKYESNVFEAGGYNWKLSLYPTGDKKNNGNNFISLYLAIAEPEKLPPRWEINVKFELFVYNQIQDRYLAIQDVKRFHYLKTRWGFTKLLPLQAFKDPSNGYLVDDSCVFGAEVFLVNQTRNWESLSLLKGPDIKNASFSWKIESFSNLDEASYMSKLFTAGGRDWKLAIYPNGNGKQKGKAFSFYLCPVFSGDYPSKTAFYAKYKLRVVDQISGDHFVKGDSSHWFDETVAGWGFPNFMSLKDLQQPLNGYLMDNAVIVEVEFLVMSETKIVSQHHEE